jgi:hypothetical protein
MVFREVCVGVRKKVVRIVYVWNVLKFVDVDSSGTKWRMVQKFK